MTGKVKWWNNKAGIGFITAAPTGEDVFVHCSAIQGGGGRYLNVGETVSFDLVPSEKGPKTANVIRERK